MVMSNPTPDPWSQEIATLIGDLYRLLAKMGWLTPKMIAYPPHTNPRINNTLAESLGYSQEAIKLLEILPCVKHRPDPAKFGDEFILRGMTADMRHAGTLKEARNPFYAEEDTWGESPNEGWYQEYGRYMRPWYVALDRLGNHGTVMILNMHNSGLDLTTLQRDFKRLLCRAFVAHRSRVIRD